VNAKKHRNLVIQRGLVTIAKRSKYMDSCKTNDIPWFENKNGMIRDSIFIHSDPGYAKTGKPRENGAKIKRYRDEKWTKKVISHSLDTSFIA
jgi:hypothetical protein